MLLFARASGLISTPRVLVACGLPAIVGPRQLLHIPYMKDLVKRFRRDPKRRQVCGYSGRVPCKVNFIQMKKRIQAEGFRAIEAWLHREALRLRKS